MIAVSIVIPALNERRNLELLLPQIASACNSAGLEWEILVVDGDSGDGTREMIGKCAVDIQVRYLNEPVRGDLARAWRCGIEAGRHPVLLTMDADFCHSPAFIPDLLDAMGDADMVIASRYLRGWSRQMPSKPLLFELLSRGGQWFFRQILGLPLTDATHGFRAFRRELYDQLKDSLTTPGNVFMAAFAFHAIRRGFRIRELSYSYGKRLHGEEHMDVASELRRYLAFFLDLWRSG